MAQTRRKAGIARRGAPTTRLRKKVTLVVDTREPASLDAEIEAVGFEVFRQTMPTGDFLWVAKDGRSIAVERKTAGDLLSSIGGRQANGHSRLQNQMERMVKEFDVPLLLIEGNLQGGSDGFTTAGTRSTKWYWDSVDNLLMSLQRGGITVVHCARGRVPERLVTLNYYFDRKVHTLLSPVVVDSRVEESPEREEAA